MSEVRATYWIESNDISAAVRAICRGQSVGNPTILTAYETRQFVAQWGATGQVDEHYHAEHRYVVTIHWPAKNFGLEGLNYLLSVLMGGQCDVDVLQSCRLMELQVGSLARHWATPRWGLPGIRKLLHVPTRALVGGIIKPKIGLRPAQLAEVVKRMAEGGCDFIKEDEILADQYWCPMRVRLPLVKKALTGASTLYAACITADGGEAWKKARLALEWGASAIHLNIWCGLGTYLNVWNHVKAPLFFQKSGDKVWTTGPYSIDYSVICQLLHLAGCDFAHVGMYGGYLAESVEVLQRRIKKLKTTIPSFSCGMTPVLASQIVDTFGNNVMVTSGGWVHGQPQGTIEAVKQLRHAVEVADRTGQSVSGGLALRGV